MEKENKDDSQPPEIGENKPQLCVFVCVRACTYMLREGNKAVENNFERYFNF